MTEQKAMIAGLGHSGPNQHGFSEDAADSITASSETDSYQPAPRMLNVVPI